MKLKLGLAIAAALVSASQAGAFMATNSLIVRATGPDSFEVPYRGLNGPGDFWCAAGDYVIRELELPADTRIYRTSSPPRRAGQGMTFSLNAQGAKKTGLVRLNRGRGVTASHARNLCEIPRLINQD